ncbi:MAG: hypothetical protein MUC55_10210 [Burkholderiales bacterium]|nr:hypothetical protein [Burkholderiales bacterium]
MRMQPAGTHKYGFRIKTHSGPVVEHLLIHGRDEAEATRKLERMYPNCRVLECVRPAAAAADSFETVADLLSR